MRTALAYTLRRLGVDYMDVYRSSRLDPNVPIEDTVGAIADMVRPGYVRHVGLSEVGPETIRRAAAVHPIADLQIEYSLISRGIEGGILDVTRELGIGVTAYSVLSRGLMSRHRPWIATPGDFRAHSPRFQGGNLDANLGLAERLGEVARGFGLTPVQAAIAWALGKGQDIVPLVGARTRERLKEALGALRVDPAAGLVVAVEAAIPKDAARGERYPAAQMALLDSERRSA